MARKSTKNISKVLGGLGAMYALSKLPVGEGVRPEDVNKEDAARDKLETEQRLARLRAPAHTPAPAPANQPAASAPEPSARAVPPVMSPEEIAKLRAETARGFRERENQIDLREQANREPAIFKKGGGAVKGWGKARGARAAKVY